MGHFAGFKYRGSLLLEHSRPNTKHDLTQFVSAMEVFNIFMYLSKLKCEENIGTALASDH